MSGETTAPIREYRRAKRATGAPVDLEDAAIHAADRCQEAMEALRYHLEKARREADERLASLGHSGVRMGQFTWFVLDGRKTAEDLNARLCAARERFEGAVELWAALADRIVATDEDRVAATAEKRQRAIRILAARPARELRAMAKTAGLKVGTDREEIAAALVDGGYLESLGAAS